ncbi:xylose isomerase-like protein [Parathielavia hyrcaniae]|uniref:Xylose isomerase-like protein n=1 Tax=Parathielavia hyrcaniae TaxID=113614 RepID=A0AAN6SY65_9PEZI|nr:xylose isomerase-like protein [Parathielavia hyrcaniae]
MSSTSETPSSVFHPVAFASCSIGLPRHTLHQKIEAVREAGFDGIELSFPDLASYASRHFGREIAQDDYGSLCEAARTVREMCAGHGLSILVLQPFTNFEGWAEGSSQRQEAFARAEAWIDIMEAAGTDMLQVGSSNSPDMTRDLDQIAADLGCLADMLAARGFRLAYENWCWATCAPTWRDVWTIVNKANRPNVGLCLDTFQTAGGEWGDPTTSSGRIESGGITAHDLARTYAGSLDELSRTVPGDKIYFLQISDAYRLEPPLDAAPSPGSGLRPRGRWSHEHRPLPYGGGYLPIVDFVRAVLKTGFRGWTSIEVFDGKFEEKYGDDLRRFSKTAMEAYQRLMAEASTESTSKQGT